MKKEKQEDVKYYAKRSFILDGKSFNVGEIIAPRFMSDPIAIKNSRKEGEPMVEPKMDKNGITMDSLEIETYENKNEEEGEEIELPKPDLESGNKEVEKVEEVENVEKEGDKKEEEKKEDKKEEDKGKKNKNKK